jgi:uncharacterized repeat protein (TIGR04138 family)
MLEPTHPIAELLREDRRYAFEAYVFVFEALAYAQNVLSMGTETKSAPLDVDDRPDEDEDEEEAEQHVSGQELCEAIRQFALEQYGYMAKTVLNSWGVHNTGDFGEIVFNLIGIGQMRKTPQDCREDFANVYDFDVALKEGFKITRPE